MVAQAPVVTPGGFLYCAAATYMTKRLDTECISIETNEHDLNHFLRAHMTDLVVLLREVAASLTTALVH